MQTKQTNPQLKIDKVQLETRKFTCADFGVPFLLPAQEMLLYPAASEAVKGFEGSYPYKVQRESTSEGQTPKKVTQILTEPVGQSGWRGRDGDW